MNLLPVATVQQAGEILGVSDSRIRQLLGEGVLRPAYRSGRSVLLWRSELAAYASRSVTSQVAGTMPPLAEPLHLVVDTVMMSPAASAWDLIEQQPLHIRIYQGNQPTADTPPRTVVLLAEPVGEGLRVLTNRIEKIAEAVAKRFLNGAVADAVWVDVWPPSNAFNQPWSTAVEIRNVLLTQSEAVWRPSWSPMTINELETLIGGAEVDWFEWNSYSPGLINRWQRTGRPVEVTVDPKGLQPAVAAYQALDGVQHPAADTARRVILHLLAWRASRSPAPWSPDVFDQAGLDEPASINTTTRHDFEMPADIQALLPELSDPAPSPAQTHDEVESLQQWLDEVDQWSDNPDERLSRAVQLALGAARSRDRSAQPDRSEESETIDEFILTAVHLQHASWDQDYLDRITWQAADPTNDMNLPLRERRLVRRLRARAGQFYDDRDSEFGRDFMGNWVLRYSYGDQDHGYTPCIIAWPTTYDGFPLPQGVEIVAVGESGDLPVYLARHGGLIGLLPRSSDFSAWNFGYGGGGPGNLERDIQRFLRDDGFRVDETVIRRILVAVEQSTQDDLAISVDSLVSPYQA